VFSWLSSMVGRLWRWQRLARIQPDRTFSDPAIVEDDYWRLRPESARRW
jgi:hypothetical protein